MDEILEEYRKLKPKQKVFAEILIYSFIAFHTKNDSGVKITKGRKRVISGKKILEYGIEVPIDD